jgi:transposase
VDGPNRHLYANAWIQSPLLMLSTPGVGVLVALSYAAAIDDPFRSSKAVGAHFGQTPKKNQPRAPHGALRGSNEILTRPVAGPSLKSWAMRVANRAGEREAKIAQAFPELCIPIQGLRSRRPLASSKGPTWPLAVSAGVQNYHSSPVEPETVPEIGYGQ